MFYILDPLWWKSKFAYRQNSHSEELPHHGQGSRSLMAEVLCESIILPKKKIMWFVISSGSGCSVRSLAILALGCKAELSAQGGKANQRSVTGAFIRTVPDA